MELYDIIAKLINCTIPDHCYKDKSESEREEYEFAGTVVIVADYAYVNNKQTYVVQLNDF